MITYEEIKKEFNRLKEKYQGKRINTIQFAEITNINGIFAYGFSEIIGTSHGYTAKLISKESYNIGPLCRDFSDSFDFTVVPASKPIDNVDVQNLGAALKICDIELNEKEVDLIIELVELIELKGDNITLDEIFKIKEGFCAQDL